MSAAFKAGQLSMQKRAMALCEELSERASIACVMTSGPEKEQHVFAYLAACELEWRIESLAIEEPEQ